jgi:oligopeptide transport system ATP-binding protein
VTGSFEDPAFVDPGAGATAPVDFGLLPPEVPKDVPAGAPLLRVTDLVKHFEIRGGLLGITKIGAVRAVDGVTFDVRRGETLGLVGESGCGKTTLGKVILRLLPATSGRVEIDGKPIFDLPTAAERKAGARSYSAGADEMKQVRRDLQVVFQDPYASLNPRMTVGEIVGEGPLVHGLKDKTKRDDLVRELLGKVGLNQSHIHRYPHEFSGGQRQRIGIARALALNPEFIVCDEPVSALDVSIQSQVLNLLDDLQQELGLTYLFIAHNLAVVEHISDRVGVMYLGRLAEMANVADVYAQPRHPYTVALLSAVPNPDPRVRKKRLVLQGDVPSPAAPPSGCRFHTRCWLRTRLGNPEDCETIEPQLRPVAPGHMVACHYAEQITDTMVGELVPIAQRGAAATPYRSAPSQQPQAAVEATPSPDDAASAGV